LREEREAAIAIGRRLDGGRSFKGDGFGHSGGSVTKTAMKQIGEMARKQGLEDFKWINPQEIVTGHWVRAKCIYGCPRYGLKACCPPEVPSVAECRSLFDEYRKGLFFHIPKKFEDSKMRFPWAREVNKAALLLEREVFLLGFHKAFIFTASPCNICVECKSAKRECRNPSLARPTLEAYSVDVFTTARKFGYPVRVLKGYEEETNRYGVLLVD
jgi:predicted metal-binding protein